MSKFSKEWEGTERNRLKEILGTQQQPLKSKLEFAIRKIEAQGQAIDGTINRLTERDRSIFAKVVNAYAKHDTRRANAYANELAEVRKMESYMMGAKLALERVTLRLGTITQLGNAASTIAPAVKVLQNIRTGISGIMPGAESELGGIAGLLDEIMIEAGQTTGMGFDFEVVSEDAQNILAEAATVAEQKMKERFPELPTLKASAEGVQQPGYGTQ